MPLILPRPPPVTDLSSKCMHLSVRTPFPQKASRANPLILRTLYLSAPIKVGRQTRENHQQTPEGILEVIEKRVEHDRGSHHDEEQRHKRVPPGSIRALQLRSFPAQHQNCGASQRIKTPGDENHIAKQPIETANQGQKDRPCPLSQDRDNRHLPDLESARVRGVQRRRHR